MPDPYETPPQWRGGAPDPYTKTCLNCENRCMDMDLDPYCAAFNKPYGLILHKAKEQCIVEGKLTRWQRDRRGERKV